jgi:succinylglutamic semialdehyde dehydrogenase
MSLWINGDWQSGRGPARSKHNPVSQALLWQGNDADAGQVALAVTAARAAFPAWARQPFAARQAIAEKFASLLEANKGELTGLSPGDRQTALGSGNGNDGDDQQNRHFGEGVP